MMKSFSGVLTLGLMSLMSEGICTAAVGSGEQVISIAEARASVARGGKERMNIRGKVTFSNEKLGLAFVQDETAGACLDMRGVESFPSTGEHVKATVLGVRRHEMVMLQPVADATGAALVLDPAPPPLVKALRFDLDGAAKLHADGLLTRVSGVIRRVTVPSVPGAPMSVEVSFPSGYVVALLPWQETPAQRATWLNAPVIFNGVLLCPAPPALAPLEADALLLVPGRLAWDVRRNEIDRVFAQPAVLSAGEITAPAHKGAALRVHIIGTVTAAKPKQWVTLRMQDRSVQIMTRQAGSFQPGEKLSVACSPQLRRGSLMLLDGVLRRRGTEPPPESLLLRGDAESAKLAPMELVQVGGVLRNDSDWRGLPFLTITPEEGTRFQIQWDTFLTATQSRQFRTGSEVAVTGILRPISRSDSSEDTLDFAIVPRSLADVRVMAGPSWWTRSRLAAAVGGLAIVAGLGLCTTLISRWQIGRQEKAIRAAEARAIAVEERARIARELHDSLQQHLAAAGLHLQTMRGAMATVPEMLPQLLDEATAMVRHCQIEARQCIWDLRSDMTGGGNLAEALSAWLRMRQSQVAGITLRLRQEGTIPSIRDEEAFQIMRIAQEAVNNAVAHASAKEIEVLLKGEGACLEVTVRDDGCGFDVNAALQCRHGHYGLQGQRERSARIQGGLVFESQLQRGTSVTLRVPAASLSA